ncbi:MAG: hypothetical protein J6D03_01135 [Clostridia bacterium]|nr:hypothetical protein [Clostridia bacterium]
MSRCTLVKYAEDSEAVGGINVSSYYDLVDKIDDNEKWISKCKEKLKMLASCTPKDMFPENKIGEDTMFQLNREFDETWECIEEANVTLNALYRIRTLVDMHRENGLDVTTLDNWNKIIVLE